MGSSVPISPTRAPMSSRPRVFYVLGSLEANDTGDEIVTILGRLSRAQFDPRVIALGGRADLQERIVEMKVRSYPLGLSGLFGTWRAVAKVRSLLKNMEAEVVHGFGSWGGTVARLAAPHGVAVVRSVSRPPTYKTDLRGRLLRFMEKRARSRVGTRFVVPNDGSRGLALRSYGAADGHIRVLPTSVDVGGVRDAVTRQSREHARIVLGLAPDETAVALMTNFESASRMDEILQGFAMALREHPKLRLFIVGSGRHEGSTRWKAEELLLGDSVIFLGRGTDSGPIWAAADVAIDASPWAAWSRPALIAIAAGVPTVKRQDGAGEWPEEIDQEFPMISGHPDRFAMELVQLANGYGLIEQVAAYGQRVAKEVDVGNVVEELGELYESLAD
jgi:glycosyltransferase involved in cell wall biosynthesis